MRIACTLHALAHLERAPDAGCMNIPHRLTKTATEITIMADANSTRIPATHPRAALTEHEVDLLRELIENGMSLREIAKKFEVHPTSK